MRSGIEDVVIGYAWAYDEDEIGAAADLFVDDGTLEVSTPGVAPAVGKEAIRAFLAAARTGRAARGERPRHLVNNVRVVDADEERATAVSYMTLVITLADGSTKVACAGTYTDRLVRVNGAWRFEARRIAFDGDPVVQPS